MFGYLWLCGMAHYGTLSPCGFWASTRRWAVDPSWKPTSPGANTGQHTCARRSDKTLKWGPLYWVHMQRLLKEVFNSTLVWTPSLSHHYLISSSYREIMTLVVFCSLKAGTGRGKIITNQTSVDWHSNDADLAQACSRCLVKCPKKYPVECPAKCLILLPKRLNWLCTTARWKACFCLAHLGQLGPS